MSREMLSSAVCGPGTLMGELCDATRGRMFAGERRCAVMKRARRDSNDNGMFSLVCFRFVSGRGSQSRWEIGWMACEIAKDWRRDCIMGSIRLVRVSVLERKFIRATRRTKSLAA
jgi:hypothetical protein